MLLASLSFSQQIIFEDDFENSYEILTPIHGGPLVHQLTNFGGAIEVPNSWGQGLLFLHYGINKDSPSCDIATFGDASMFNSGSIDYSSNNSNFLGFNPYEQYCDSSTTTNVRTTESMDLSGYDSVTIEFDYFIGQELSIVFKDLLGTISIDEPLTVAMGPRLYAFPSDNYENGIDIGEFKFKTPYLTLNDWNEAYVKVPSAAIWSNTRLEIRFNAQAGGPIIWVSPFAEAYDNIIITGHERPNSLFDQENENNYATYPNPATNYISWSFDGKVNEATVLDIDGRVVLTELNPSTEMNISGLVEGSYILLL